MNNLLNLIKAEIETFKNCFINSETNYENFTVLTFKANKQTGIKIANYVQEKYKIRALKWKNTDEYFIVIEKK